MSEATKTFFKITLFISVFLLILALIIGIPWYLVEKNSHPVSHPVQKEHTIIGKGGSGFRYSIQPVCLDGYAYYVASGRHSISLVPRLSKDMKLVNCGLEKQEK